MAYLEMAFYRYILIKNIIITKDSAKRYKLLSLSYF